MSLILEKIGCIKVRTGLLALALCSMVAGFWNLLSDHAPVAFSSVEEDMSFGWYVPLFSLYVLWRERKEIVASVGRPSVWGLLATVPFLLLGFMGVRGVQMRFEVVSFAGLLVTLAWALFGAATARRVLFPAAFLLFCIPLATFLDVITVHLRLFATSVAYWMMAGFGMEIVRRGTAILASDGSFSIDVAAPCSGLRSIFALMALTAGYAYFTQRTWLKRGLLFALSVPLAVFGNVMRILSIGVVAHVSGEEFALGFYHDYSGYIVFLVAIALMVACGGLIAKIPQPEWKGRVGGGGSAGTEGARGGVAPIVPWVTVGLVVAVMAVLASTPQPTFCQAPEISLCDIDGFDRQELESSETERNVLPKDTLIRKSVYIAPDGHGYRVSVVTGGRSKSSIHRPELCLPSQGFLMTNPHTRVVDGIDWRFITLAGAAGQPSQGFAYTFFNQDGYRTSSHVSRIFRDVCDRSFLNRIDRWTMVTVHASLSDEAALKAFLKKIKGVVK